MANIANGTPLPSLPRVKLNEGRGEMTIDFIRSQIGDFLDGNHIKDKYKFKDSDDPKYENVKGLHKYLNSVNEYGYTPLQTAVGENNEEVVDFLLNLGPNNESYIIDVDYRDDTTHTYTPFHSAIINGNIHILKALIKAEADSTIGREFETQKFSPIYSACEKGNIEIVKLVLKDLHDIEKNHERFTKHINTPLSEGTYLTPLFIATIKGHIEVAKLLLKNGANLGGVEILHSDLDNILSETVSLSVAHTLVEQLDFVTDTFGMERIPELSKTGGGGYSPLFNLLRNYVTDENTEIIKYLIAKKFRLKEYEQTRLKEIRDSYSHFREHLTELKTPPRIGRKRGFANTTDKRIPKKITIPRIVSPPYRWERVTRQTPHSQTPHSQTPHSQTPHSQTPHSQTPHSQTPNSHHSPTGRRTRRRLHTPRSHTPRSHTPRSHTPHIPMPMRKSRRAYSRK